MGHVIQKGFRAVSAPVPSYSVIPRRRHLVQTLLLHRNLQKLHMQSFTTEGQYSTACSDAPGLQKAPGPDAESVVLSRQIGHSFAASGKAEPMTRVAAWGKTLLNVLTGNDGVNEVLEGGCDSGLGGQGAGQSRAGGHCESCRHGQRLLPLLSAANRRELSHELQSK